MTGFLNNFTNDYKESFDPAFRNIILKEDFNLMYLIGERFSGIRIATKFFKKDTEIITKLWKINEIRTLFHDFFENPTNADDATQMTKIVDENFNIEDKKKIIEGKNQAANFLRMSWQKRRNKNNTIAFMDAVNFKFDFEALRNAKNFENLMQIVVAQNYTNEELFEFFVHTLGSRAIKTEADKEILKNYGRRMLSADDYKAVKKIWGNFFISERDD
jgi:hypothetical protein